MIKELKWESEILKKKITEFRFEKLENNKKDIERFLKEKQIDLMQSCIELDNKEGIEFLENNKFHFQDLKLSYKMNLNMNEKNENIDYKIAVEEDIEDIKRISRELFYYSRFNILGERASKEIYEIWAEKAIKGEFDDICLKVQDENNKTAGFITLKKISEKEAKIGIIAVELNKQKAGYGKILMDGAKKYLIEQGIDKFYVVTQGKNINAQNFYINSGFRMDKIEMWYYRTENIKRL